MRKLTVALFALVIVATGCRSYTASEVPVTEPNDKSYCQRIDDMAVGIEPYMKNDKTHYTFNEDLWDEQILALDIAMLSDGGNEYTVNTSEIMATDEFENEYSPMDVDEVAERIRNRGLGDAVHDSALPDVVTVTDEVTQGFVYFDMTQNNATSRRFTVDIFADGAEDKAFSITVDPYRMHMNPTERWSNYVGGVTPCGDFAKAEEEKEMMMAPSSADADRMEEAAKRAEEAADRAEKAAQKQERIYEKQLSK